MISKIKALEKASQALEPDKENREKIRIEIEKQVARFIEKLPRGSVLEEEGAAQNLDALPPKEEGYNQKKILDTIEESLLKPGINMASGGLLAYIPGGGLYVSALADYLTAATDKYAGVYETSPGAARMENRMVRWLCNLVGYDEDSFGHLSSGGSMANLTAIVTARDEMKLLENAAEKVIYFTHQVHHCLIKALRITGLAQCKIQLVPMTDDLKMDVTSLQRLVKQHKEEGLVPSLVVGSAGTTDLGRIDDIQAIHKIAKLENMWFHVDGAYGGFFLLTEMGKKELKGIQEADSVVLDPHKGMFLPYGSGAVLIKKGCQLFNSFYMKANYLQDTQVEIEDLADFNEVSPSDVSPELSRHFRGLRMWLPLQLYGEKVFQSALEEKILLARYFHERIQKLGFETGPYPELSVTIFRYVPEEYKDDLEKVNAFNRKLMQAVQQERKVFIASTTINGVNWLRLAVLSFRTHLYHIESLLTSLKKRVG